MRQIRVPVKKTVYMLLLFPLIEPAIFEQVRILDQIFNLLKLVSFVSIFLLYIGKRGKIDKFILTILSCYFIGVVSTAFHGGWLYKAALQFVSVAAMVLLAKMLLEEDPMLCFDVFLPLLELLLYTNLVSIILFPNGMYTEVTKFYKQTSNWVLGLDNVQVIYYVAGMAIVTLRDYYRFGRLKLSVRSLMLIAVCYITVFIRWQVTALVGLAIIFPAILFPQLFAKSRSLNIVTYLTVVSIFFVTVVIFRTQDYFAFFIQDVLHKSLTFSGRTPVWDNAMAVISANLLLGIGTPDREIAWEYLGQAHAHNIFLHMLVSGGALQLALFLFLNILVARKLMKNNHSGIASFLSVTIFSMLIMNQMEPYETGLWYMVYTLAYYSDRIISRQKSQEYPELEKSCLVQTVH